MAWNTSSHVICRVSAGQQGIPQLKPVLCKRRPLLHITVSAAHVLGVPLLSLHQHLSAHQYVHGLPSWGLSKEQEDFSDPGSQLLAPLRREDPAWDKGALAQ